MHITTPTSCSDMSPQACSARSRGLLWTKCRARLGSGGMSTSSSAGRSDRRHWRPNSLRRLEYTWTTSIFLPPLQLSRAGARTVSRTENKDSFSRLSFSCLCYGRRLYCNTTNNNKSWDQSLDTNGISKLTRLTRQYLLYHSNQNIHPLCPHTHHPLPHSTPARARAQVT